MTTLTSSTSIGGDPVSLDSSEPMRSKVPEDPGRIHGNAWGIQEICTAPRSPWQNAHAERVIGSIRRECLDHVIVVNEIGLARVSNLYLAYYHSHCHA